MRKQAVLPPAEHSFCVGPQAGGSPAPALQLAALMAGVWHAAACNDAASPLLTAASTALALAALPHSLPALLRLKAWQPAAGAVAHRLGQLLSSEKGLPGRGGRQSSIGVVEYWQSGRSGRDSQGSTKLLQGSGDGGDARQANSVLGAAAACLVAMRELLPESECHQVSLVALDWLL